MMTQAQKWGSTAAAKVDEAVFAGLGESNPYEDEGRTCEIQTYEQRYNSRGDQVLLRSSRRSALGWEHESSHEAALVLTRFYSEARDLKSTQLKIQSPFIRKALKEVVRSYPGVNIDSNGHILIHNEPWCLFHYRGELAVYASKLREKTAKDHINLCLQYMETVLRKEITSYETQMYNAYIMPGLEFQNLWMAFKPGALLYRKFKDANLVYRFTQMKLLKNRQTSTEHWEVCTEVLLCRRKEFEYICQKVDISHFDGYRPLQEMEIFPLDYHPEQDAIKASILKRGKKYVSLVGTHHCTYDGLADIISKHGGNAEPHKLHGRVMMDSEEFYSTEGCCCGKVSDRKPIRMDSHNNFKLCDEELLICQHQMPGFSLARKEWGFFDVSKLSLVDYNRDAYTSLVLPSDAKKTLTSLVRLQKEDSSPFDDLVVGKGKGLLILLHGPPGVGKTFTAESIAEYSQRPLYALDGVDFNVRNSHSERHLGEVLSRASRWNAVVLMDEADVFMQQRNTSDYVRNEQVSELLRTLEYFEGIIFLTTNRVQTIDSAFKSRIHLSLTYPNFSPEARSKLWTTFILKAMNQHHPQWLSTDFLKKISDEEVNGREIKNIIRVAHALAVNDERSIEATDILQGLRSLKDFERDFNNAAGKRQFEDDEGFTSSKKPRHCNCDPID